jgi:hypothetical protein
MSDDIFVVHEKLGSVRGTTGFAPYEKVADFPRRCRVPGWFS